ncbi:MAG: hypothetical protein U9Q29_05955 [Campylobacterota bacterium]|nr:hypothetical protein [Campylobacterota bacterium]
MVARELVEIPMATLDFYKYEENGLVFYEFDATECSMPEPMANAMAGLNMIKSENDRMVGLFFHEPSPLLAKISPYFSYKSKELESGDFRIVFKKL